MTRVVHDIATEWRYARIIYTYLRFKYNLAQANKGIKVDKHDGFVIAGQSVYLEHSFLIFPNSENPQQPYFVRVAHGKNKSVYSERAHNYGRGFFGQVKQTTTPDGRHYAEKVMWLPNSTSLKTRDSLFANEVAALKVMKRLAASCSDVGVFKPKSGLSSLFSSAAANLSAATVRSKHVLQKVYLLQEVAEGCSLKRYIAKKKDMALFRKVHIALSMMQELHQLASGRRAHLDVSPSNVHYDEDSGRVTLLDFGFSRIIGQQADWRGKHEYMAPEFIYNRKHVLDTLKGAAKSRGNTAEHFASRCLEGQRGRRIIDNQFSPLRHIAHKVTDDDFLKHYLMHLYQHGVKMQHREKPVVVSTKQDVFSLGMMLRFDLQLYTKKPHLSRDREMNELIDKMLCFDEAGRIDLNEAMRLLNGIVQNNNIIRIKVKEERTVLLEEAPPFEMPTEEALTALLKQKDEDDTLDLDTVESTVAYLVETANEIRRVLYDKPRTTRGVYQHFEDRFQYAMLRYLSDKLPRVVVGRNKGFLQRVPLSLKLRAVLYLLDKKPKVQGDLSQALIDMPDELRPACNLNTLAEVIDDLVGIRRPRMKMGYV